jgi:hypothetical protein
LREIWSAAVTQGHVFVVHGDLTQLACDDIVIPSDVALRVSDHWRSVVPGELDPKALGLTQTEWEQQRCGRVRRIDEAGGTDGVWLLNTTSRAERDASWFAEGVRAVLEAVAQYRRGSRPGRGRARHLVALPLVGVGRGGADAQRGDLIAAVLDVLEQRADASQDVALVLLSARDHGAVQHLRRGRVRHELSAGEVDRAKDLAARARVNELALFLGAGVSMSAGLPSWTQLLDLLARRADIPAQETAELRTLPAQDAATLIAQSLREPLEDALAAVLPSGKYGLAHALLAALPVWEAVTTNYDSLFEAAWAAVGRRPAVLPFEPPVADRPYLLKLHGDLTRRRGVVLTRGQYLRFGGVSGALAGVVQGLLMTRHVLFAGFSLADENFLQLVDEVRRVREDDRLLGTALALLDEPLRRRLWEGELAYHAFADRPDDTEQTDQVLGEAARRLEIFLDLVAHEATEDTSFLLDTRYAYLLSPAEQAFGVAVRHLIDVPRPGGNVGRRVEALLEQLGFSK